LKLEEDGGGGSVAEGWLVVGCSDADEPGSFGDTL
jgi:hypothetical protein